MDRTIQGRGKRNLFLSLTIVGVLLSSVSCDAGTFLVDPLAAPDQQVFALSPTEMTLGVGESATITPTLVRSNGDPVNPRSLKWASTDPSRATVTTDGVVTGVAQGHASIVASSGNLADTTWLRIVERREARAGVKISPDTIILQWLNATAILTAEVRDDAGTLVAQPGLTWRSLNPEIAQANDMGVVTAKGVGMALIVATAACCDQADTAYVRVHQVVDEVVIEEEKVLLSPGASAHLTPLALDRGGSTVAGVSFDFNSADESVVQVSADGLVTSQSPGTTTVTAASDGHSDSVTVEVAGSETGGTSPGNRNEPAGFSKFAENNFHTKWGDGGSGQIGFWRRWSANTDIRLTAGSDGSAPVAGPGVNRTLYPIGLSAGEAPINAGAWEELWNSGPQYERFYRRLVWKLDDHHGDGLWEGQGQVKILGFLGYGDISSAHNQGYHVLVGGSAGKPVGSFTMDFRQQGHVSSTRTCNTTVVVGTWQDWEEVFVLNDIGKSNGEYHLWVNGRHRVSYTNVTYRTAAYPAGFFLWKNNPTWGGTGSSGKTRDDYVVYDYVYISGVKLK
jgi:hypothetical protein